MLEKLITNLKQSLPEPLRKKLGMEENHQDEEESSEHSEELNEESHDTSDNESGGGEDKKKKQMSMLIRVVVVLALAYMAIDQFVLKSDDPSTEVADIPVVPRKPRRKVVPAPTEGGSEVKKAEGESTEAKPEAKTEESSTAKAPETAPETAPEVAPEAAGTAPVEQAPIENINIADKKAEEVPPQVVGETAAVGEVKSSETPIDKSIDSLIDSVDAPAKTDNASADKKEIKLEDKIVADDNYTPPPAYDQLGRGLVYNCKEKYWACIDKMAYVSCNKNMKWNVANGKAAECVVQNVYNSDDDCNIVQKYNVSTNKETPFCK